MQRYFRKIQLTDRAFAVLLAFITASIWLLALNRADWPVAILVSGLVGLFGSFLRRKYFDQLEMKREFVIDDVFVRRLSNIKDQSSNMK